MWSTLSELLNCKSGFSCCRHAILPSQSRAVNISNRDGWTEGMTTDAAPRQAWRQSPMYQSPRLGPPPSAMSGGEMSHRSALSKKEEMIAQEWWAIISLYFLSPFHYTFTPPSLHPAIILLSCLHSLSKLHLVYCHTTISTSLIHLLIHFCCMYCNYAILTGGSRTHTLQSSWWSGPRNWNTTLRKRRSCRN
mgnify:CR=1 FL=1